MKKRLDVPKNTYLTDNQSLPGFIILRKKDDFRWPKKRSELLQIVNCSFAKTLIGMTFVQIILGAYKLHWHRFNMALSFRTIASFRF